MKVASSAPPTPAPKGQQLLGATIHTHNFYEAENTVLLITMVIERGSGKLITHQYVLTKPVKYPTDMIIASREEVLASFTPDKVSTTVSTDSLGAQH